MSAYEKAQFGDGSDAGSGNVLSTVHTYFGVREVGEGLQGKQKTYGKGNEIVVKILAEDITAASFALIAPEIPAGAVVVDVLARVTEAFVLGGTTPAIEIGTETSEETNGFTITEAQAEATGVYDLTSALSGTWAAPLAADTTVGIALSGTSPTITDAGAVEVVITYDFV